MNKLDPSALEKKEIPETESKTTRWKKTLLPGIGLCFFIAVLSQLTSFLPLTDYGFGPHTIAIILGILIVNIPIFSKVVAKCKPGIDFSKLWILKTAVVLYGFRLNIQELIEIGSVGLFVDILVLTSTVLLTYYIGIKFFKLDEKLVILMGTGASICGSAAILATAPTINAESDKVTVAVGTVVVCGTISIFLFPQLFAHGVWDYNSYLFGIYAGSTVLSVTTVAGATAPINAEVAAVALTTKLLKVSMLAPYLLLLGFLLNHRDIEREGTSKIKVPWFAFMFIVMVGFNSLNLLPLSVVATINRIDSFLLIVALAGLGLTTSIKTIRETGIKPIFLAAIAFSWLLIGGSVILKIVLIAEKYLGFTT